MADAFNLDDLAETINQRVALLKPIHEKKRAALAALAERHRHIREAPPDRSAVADFLMAVADRYCDLHETDLRNRFQPNLIVDPFSANSLLEGWSMGLRSRVEPDSWFVIPLLREVFRRGAIDLAERWPWPETDVVSACRQTLLSELEESMRAISHEIEALENEAAKVGMRLS
jgi:hypothetical protein